MEGRERSASDICLILKGLFGGPDRDRTDDLFHAISKGESVQADTQKHEATQRGSVHAGFAHVRCLLCVPE